MARPNDPEHLRFIAEGARKRARAALTHYFNLAFEHAGGRLSGDCHGEVESIADDIIEAAECLAVASMLERGPAAVVDDTQLDKGVG